MIKKQLDNKQQGNSELLLSKEREIFKNIYNKKLKKNYMNYLTKLIMVTSTGLHARLTMLV